MARKFKLGCGCVADAAYYNGEHFTDGFTIFRTDLLQIGLSDKGMQTLRESGIPFSKPMNGELVTGDLANPPAFDQVLNVDLDRYTEAEITTTGHRDGLNGWSVKVQAAGVDGKDACGWYREHYINMIEALNGTKKRLLIHKEEPRIKGLVIAAPDNTVLAIVMPVRVEGEE